VTAIHNKRKAFLITIAFVAGITLYAAATAGIVEATAFAPVFLGIYLLERKRSS
jgi:hypothetical protein